MKLCTYIKGAVKWTSSGESDIDFRLVAKMSVEDALVNVLLSLVDLLWDWVVMLEKSNVGGFSIVEVNREKRNSGR